MSARLNAMRASSKPVQSNTFSNDGKQIDAIVTSLTNPDGSIGSFSISVTQLRE